MSITWTGVQQARHAKATLGNTAMSDRLPINIDGLVRRRTIESERVEYKAGWNPETVLHTLGAFANDFHNLGGGYVVLGVEERNGRPVLPPKGLDPDAIDGMQKEMLNLGNSAIQPPYHPLTAVHEIDGKTILILYAPGGETRPYRTRISPSAGSREWAYYIRKHSSTVRARGEDERELLGLAATVPFDDRYHQNASPDDLSLRLIQQHLQDVGSDLLSQVTELSMEALGRRMNIVGGPSEALSPKNVGLLFFNDRPCIAHRPHFLETYLNPALKAGLIEMTLPDKPTSRNQRYRRTSAGEALAHQLTEPSK